MANAAEMAKLERGRHLIPEHMWTGITEYFRHGQTQGSFLMAVLTNDLRESVLRADNTNRRQLHNYIRFLYNHAPTGSWGSPDNVSMWIQGCAEKREAQGQ